MKFSIFRNIIIAMFALCTIVSLYANAQSFEQLARQSNLDMLRLTIQAPHAKFGLSPALQLKKSRRLAFLFGALGK